VNNGSARKGEDAGINFRKVPHKVFIELQINSDIEHCSWPNKINQSSDCSEKWLKSVLGF
jgi:hypothetical protein